MIQQLQINNAKLYLQKAQNLPILDIQLNFRAGSAFDGKLNGLADIAVGMFATKIKSSSEQELINEITDIGISIHAETNKEFFSIKLRLLNDLNTIEKTIKLLEKIFVEPEFDINILEREKIQTQTHINYLNDQPSYLASLEFSKQLFKNNPYANPTIGYKATIDDISIENIKSFFTNYICANNANICMVGAIDDTTAIKVAKKIVNALPTGKKNTKIFKQINNSQNTIRKKFKSKQTSILLGHQLLLEIDDPLYFPLKLGNEILGGNGLNSLFFNKVREEMGLVYNIGSSINLNPDYGSFIISAQTSNPELALKTINKVYSKFVSQKIDEQTLGNAKKHIEGTHLISSVKNSSKLSMLTSIANKDLPLDFFSSYIDNINSVTSSQIEDAFQQVQKNKFITVMVGNIKE